jgi:hypothetical protein
MPVWNGAGLVARRRRVSSSTAIQNGSAKASTTKRRGSVTASHVTAVATAMTRAIRAAREDMPGHGPAAAIPSLLVAGT